MGAGGAIGVVERVLVLPGHVDVVDASSEHVVVELVDAQHVGDEGLEGGVGDFAGAATGGAAFLAFGADPVFGGDLVLGLRVATITDEGAAAGGALPAPEYVTSGSRSRRCDLLPPSAVSCEEVLHERNPAWCAPNT